MQRIIKAGHAADAGLIFHVFAMDSTLTTGVGKASVGFASWTCYYIRAGGAISGAITPQDITTIGTYAAPTANTNIRIKAVDNTNMIGVYELQLHLDWVATGSESLTIYLTASGVAPIALTIPLVLIDPQTAAVTADVTKWLGTAAATPTVAGVPEVDVTHWIGTAAATPTTAGVPEVDVTHWTGGAITTGVPLAPTTAGRTLDVTATGAAGIDWGNVENPNTTITFAATTFATVTGAGVTSIDATPLAAIATKVWQDTTAGDFTVASSIGKALYINDVAPGGSGGHMISGSNAGTTTFGAWTVTGATNLTGAVTLGSTLDVTGATTFTGLVECLDRLSLKCTAGGDRATLNIYGSAGATTKPVVLIQPSVLAPAGIDGVLFDSLSGGGSMFEVAGTSTTLLPADSLTAAALAADAGTELGTAVWATATRTLTAGTNIQLPATGLDLVLAGSTFGGAMADAVWDEVIDGTLTGRQSFRLVNSACHGKASGLATTTAIYRDVADSKDRITATVDADGNRSAVTRDAT